MISGLTRSTAFQITKSQLLHLRKLDEINTAKTTLLDFDYNPQESIALSRKRHARSRSFKNLQQSRQLKSQNRKIVMSMVKIAGRDVQFPSQRQSKKHRKHGNNFYEEQKRKKNIERENFIIANRILSQKSQFSEKKDQLQFRQSRERLKRLEKFTTYKKIMESSKTRLLSEPASKQWIETKKRIIGMYRNAQTQT